MDLERHHQINHASVTASTINIPDDLLIAEVLASLPVKSIVRFKCVQKSWLAATKNDWFVCRHLKFSRAMPPDVLIVPREECSDDEDEEIGLSNEISFYRLREPLSKDIDDTKVELMLEAVQPEVITHTILATHCDGLVAIATATDQVYVSNPATKEFVTLPLGSHDVREIKIPSAAIGFDPWRNQYVIVRYFYRNYMVLEDEDTGERSFEYDIGHEVFTLGLGHSWEITDNPPLAICPFARPVCMRGAFYWCTDGMLNEYMILCFNLYDEKFGMLPFPPGCHYLGNYLVDDKPEPVWSQCSRIDVFSNEISTYGFFPILSRDTEMLIAVDDEKLYQLYEWSDTMSELVDMEDGLEYERADGSKLTFGEIGRILYYVVPFVESLVSISASN
uniref:F-box associated beta-propeller type 3 domain-containing protein n=1 Tax=Oryza rufipogon TaxID=4529 RepID=A0A0E0P885_ORYRU